MTTDEHLDLILERCHALLAIAEKRTLGDWGASDNVVCGESIDGYYLATCDGQKTRMSEDPCNAQFIAACAGAAEAGWQSTIAAIEYLRPDADIFGDNTHRGIAARSRISEILAAWPIETITKH